MEILIIFIVATIAGAINSVAGGGTFLTFPTLLFFGVSPITANATSTVSLWPGSIASVIGYRKKLPADKAFLKKLIIIVTIGGVIGSLLLLYTPEKNFKALVPYLLLFATLLFTFGKMLVKRFSKNHETVSETDIPKKYWTILFIISLYGGYFGAGLGILLLAVFQLVGFSDIHKMNALKKILGVAVNAIAVVIFILAGIVDYKIAAIMTVGAIIGGYFGAHISQKLNPNHVKNFVIAVAWAMTVYSFFKY